MELIATAALPSLQEEGEYEQTERCTTQNHEGKRGDRARQDAEEALNVPRSATATFQPRADLKH